ACCRVNLSGEHILSVGLRCRCGHLELKNRPWTHPPRWYTKRGVETCGDALMSHGYRHIDVKQDGSVALVRLVKSRLEEPEIPQLFNELLHLAREKGCTRIALSLGPQPPDCLYSIFLAKLIWLQRRLGEMGGGLKLCECAPKVTEILDSCAMLHLF